MDVVDPELDPHLLQERGRWILALAGDLARDPGLAEDAAQDAWVAAWGARASLQPSKAWVERVLRNRLRSLRRGERRRVAREARAARVDVVPSTLELIERMELQERVAAAVKALAEPFRTTVLLRYLHGLEPAQIAEQLQVPPGTVRSRASRGLALLRAELERSSPADERDWRARLLALVQLNEAAPSPAAAILGVIGMKQLVCAIGLVLALVLGWSLSEGPARGAVAGAGTEPSIGTLPESNAEAATLAQPGPRGQPDERRTAAAAPVTGGARPGWWLVGELHGEADSRRARLHIEGLSDQGRSELEVEVPLNQPLSVDLAPLLAVEGKLVWRLDLRLDHPAHGIVERRLTLGPEQRQAGFRPGGRSEVRFEATLEPVVAQVLGRVEAPDEQLVQVALLDAQGLRLVDRATVDATGSFGLRAAELGEHQLVAWQSRGAARPLLRRVTLEAGAALDLGTLAMEPGASITGRILGPGAAGARIAATRSGGRPAPGGLPLVFEADAWELGRAEWIADERGHFQGSGLDRSPRQVRFRGSSDHPDAKTSGDWTSVTVTPPAVGLAFSRREIDASFVLVDESGPRSDALLSHREANGAGFDVGADAAGRVALSLIPGAPYEVELRAPGRAPRHVDLSKLDPLHDGETVLELGPARIERRLMIEVRGDPERRLERLGLHAVPLTPEGRAPALRATADRAGDSFVFAWGDAPAYRVRLEPMTARGEARPEHRLLPVELELPGGEARTEGVEFPRGALIACVPGTLPGESPLRTSLERRDGEPVPHSWFVEITDGDTTFVTTDHALWPDADCSSNAPLPPGEYVLRAALEDGGELVWDLSLTPDLRLPLSRADAR